MTYLENQAYAAIRAHDQRVQQKIKLQRQARRDQRAKVAALTRQITTAAAEVAQAVALASL